MTENAVHAAPTAAPPSPPADSFGARHRRGFIAAAIVGLLLAFVGALETGDLPFLVRLAYWEILMLSGATIALGVTEVVERWGRLRLRPILEMPLIAVLIALPLTLMVIGTTSLFFGTMPPSRRAIALMFGITFAISLAMTALNYLFHKPLRAVAAPVIADTAVPSGPANAQNNRFSARLPLPLRGAEIVALEAEDHYLRVHLSSGQSTLVLMRLSDAIAELPAEAGARTHRSWWVARNAVSDFAKADGRATLTVNGSLEAPVSRSYYKALSDAGWLT